MKFLTLLLLINIITSSTIHYHYHYNNQQKKSNSHKKYNKINKRSLTSDKCNQCLNENNWDYRPCLRNDGCTLVDIYGEEKG